MLSSRRSPLIVSAAAASRLPRWVLLIVLATFVLAGFSGHLFWNARDEQVFALSWAMAEGGVADWFLPVIGSLPYHETGPAAGWLGALLISLFGDTLAPASLVKVPNLVWFPAAMGSVWYATWHLARREEAQPMVLVFGEEASPRDFGRTVADSATLLFVATFGLVARFHEIGLPMLVIAFFSILILGVVWSLARLRSGSAVAGAAIGLAFLYTDAFWALALLVADLAMILTSRAFKPFLRVRVAVTLAVAAAVAAIWPLGALLSGVDFGTWLEFFKATQAGAFSVTGPDRWIWLARNVVWYLCPVWPFAVYAVYAWRRVMRRTHITLPLAAIASSVAMLAVSGSSPEFSLAMAAVPAAILAAFGIASLKENSFANILDWFSATIFSLAAFGLWGYFYAWTSGFPVKMAASVRRLAPGMVPWVEPTLLFCAAGLTVAWFAIVVWRLRRRPKALWRGPWLAAMGLTLVWTLGTALFSGMLDANRSNIPVARELSGKLTIFGYRPGIDCVEAGNATLELKGLMHFMDIHVAEPPEACRFALLRIPKGEEPPSDAIGIPSVHPKNWERYVLVPGKSGEAIPRAGK